MDELDQRQLISAAIKDDPFAQEQRENDGGNRASVSAGGCCPADSDGDGSVGILDLLALLAVWGSDPGGPPDFDGDGTVGILDLLTLLANWGRCL